MKKLIYSVKDVKVGEFLRPFNQENNVIAVRDFTSAANTPDSQVNQYPEDFELWQLAEFDTVTGKFKNMTAACLTNAVSVIKKEKPYDPKN